MNDNLEYYIKEIFEALAVLILYKIISKSDVSYIVLFQTSALIAVITTIVERYNIDYYKNLVKEAKSPAVFILNDKGRKVV